MASNDEFDPQPRPPRHVSIFDPYYEVNLSSDLSMSPDTVHYREVETERQGRAPDLPAAPPSTARLVTAAKGTHEVASAGHMKRKASPAIHTGEDQYPNQRIKIGSDGDDKSDTVPDLTTLNKTTGPECLLGHQFANDSELESVSSTNSASSGTRCASIEHSFSPPTSPDSDDRPEINCRSSPKSALIKDTASGDSLDLLGAPAEPASTPADLPHARRDHLLAKDNQDLRSNANTSGLLMSDTLIRPDVSLLPSCSLKSHQAAVDGRPASLFQADHTSSGMPKNDASKQPLRLSARTFKLAPVSKPTVSKSTNSGSPSAGLLWQQAEDTENSQHMMDCKLSGDSAGLDDLFGPAPFDSRDRWLGGARRKFVLVKVDQRQLQDHPPDVWYWFPLSILASLSAAAGRTLGEIMETRHKTKDAVWSLSNAANFTVRDNVPVLTIRAEAHAVYITLLALSSGSYQTGADGSSARIHSSPRSVIKVAEVFAILGVSEAYHQVLVPLLQAASTSYSSPLLLLGNVLDRGLTSRTLIHTATMLCLDEDLSKARMYNLFKDKSPGIRDAVFKRITKTRKLFRLAPPALLIKLQEDEINAECGSMPWIPKEQVENFCHAGCVDCPRRLSWLETSDGPPQDVMEWYPPVHLGFSEFVRLNGATPRAFDRFMKDDFDRLFNPVLGLTCEMCEINARHDFMRFGDLFVKQFDNFIKTHNHC